MHARSFALGAILATSIAGLAQTRVAREPATFSVIDRVCVSVNYDSVDAGQGGAIQRRAFAGATVHVVGQAADVNDPLEGPAPVQYEAPLSGAARNDFRAWVNTYVLPGVKAAAKLP